MVRIMINQVNQVNQPNPLITRRFILGLTWVNITYSIISLNITVNPSNKYCSCLPLPLLVVTCNLFSRNEMASLIKFGVYKSFFQSHLVAFRSKLSPSIINSIAAKSPSNRFCTCFGISFGFMWISHCRHRIYQLSPRAFY